MLKNFDKSDFSSEIVVDDLFYDYIKTKSTPSVTGVRVIGSNDVIQLSGGSNTDVIESLKYMKETNTIYSSSIEFGIFSNMWQFMQFVLYTNYVKTYTPLRNVLGSSTFGFNGDILKDYQIRISNIIRKFIEERQKIITNPDNQLTKYNWLLCSDKIKYKLIIPIKDIPNIDEIINVDDNALSNIKKEIKKICMILTK